MKTFIQNANGQKISVLVEEAPNQKGLAFVMHGFGGFKEQTHIQAMAETFLECGYTVVRFDCRFALGESDGETIDATQTTYDDDLHDVITWASTQPWFQEPFVLAGHSLGGMTVTLYAEDHPERVRGVVPFAPVVSGELKWSMHSAEELKAWKTKGYVEAVSNSKPGAIKRQSWKLMEDIKQYDLLKKADQLTMPTLILIGEKDELLDHNKLLFEKVPGPKELHVVPGAPHTIREEKQLAELKSVLKDWVRKI